MDEKAKARRDGSSPGGNDGKANDQSTTTPNYTKKSNGSQPAHLTACERCGKAERQPWAIAEWAISHLKNLLCTKCLRLRTHDAMMAGEKLPAPEVVIESKWAGAFWEVTLRCPYCAKTHYHGGSTGERPALGHRLSHCVGNNLFNPGYRLVEVGG